MLDSDDEENLSALVEGVQVPGQVQIQALDSVKNLEQCLVSELQNYADQIQSLEVSTRLASLTDEMANPTH